MKIGGEGTYYEESLSFKTKFLRMKGAHELSVKRHKFAMVFIQVNKIALGFVSISLALH